MKRYIIIISFFLCISSAYSVTRDEMEKARTITAQQFLRYMNNGSGYLDELNPATMADLKKSIKKKEQENIKIFESIAYPDYNTYKNWGKDELLQFWGTTFFADSKMPAEGKKAKTRVRNKIGAMTISAPTPNTTNTDSTSTPAARPEESASQQAEDEAKRKLDSIINAEALQNAELADNATNEEAILDSAAANAIEAEETEGQKGGSSQIALYATILVALVAILIAIIIFAIKIYRKNDVTTKRNEQNMADENDQLRASIAERDQEIESMQNEIEMLNARLSELQARLDNQSQTTEYINKPVSKRPVRTIYLAYANSKGVFVRADSHYNEEHSLFRLTTDDGVSGSFSIVERQEASNLALSLPVSILSNSCTADDMQHGGMASQITTESMGTAVFENGRWIVTRKAVINYL